MKKSLSLCLLLTGTMLLAGCSQKFEPTESTIFVNSKGVVKSAVMESFDEAYYNFDELKGDIEAAVQAYCGEQTADAVVMESLTEENDVVTFMMQYQTVQDYCESNDMILFVGTLSEAEAAGYIPEDFHDAEGQPVELSEEEKDTLNVLVTEENVCIQTSGKIRCVSESVEILDNKLARAMEAGAAHPAFVVYK